MKKLLSEVLKEIKPTKNYEAEILEKANNIVKTLNSKIKDAKPVLGGSGAKGTWLKTFDADVFVKFKYNKYKDKSDDLSNILEKTLKKYFKISKRHLDSVYSKNPLEDILVEKAAVLL